MVHKNILARHLQLKFNHRHTPRRDCGGLNIRQGWGGERRLIVYTVEDLTDDVERRREARSAYTEKVSPVFALSGGLT